ncbi:MAG: glyoxylase-like metal-dependent hydrolase (beta-lactamase superfamily II) [Kiritimatiellia bacterium]|jgi:glyoxylase-like metal-dependent hydrolase (beta-lactamase superfamily II)
MQVKAFFHTASSTLTYVVWKGTDAVVIDPVLDFDKVTGRCWTDAVSEVADFVKSEGLTLHYVLESHAHADHLSGAQVLKQRFGAQVAIGVDITRVQDTFGTMFGLDEQVPRDGSQFDMLFSHGDVIEAGELKLDVMHTPGHTPSCTSFLVDDAVFVGDALFMPDFGTGRCDFPAGSADDLYTSISKRLYGLPDNTRVFVGHDYQPGGRELEFETTIGESKAANKQLRGDTTREQFVDWRTARDATLSAPSLLIPSIRVNIDAGRIPLTQEGGQLVMEMPQVRS